VEDLSTLRTGNDRAATRSGIWRLNASARKLLLVSHIVFGVGWMGVDIALITLLVNARTSQSAVDVISGYSAVARIVPAAVPPLCVGVLVTGALLGWGTAWGIFRHWWVFAKLILSVAMTILVFVSLLPAIQSMPDIGNVQSADAVRERLGALGIQMMFPPVVSFALLGVATFLSIFKPNGLTPWARSQP
jgi:hypothetical protein